MLKILLIIICSLIISYALMFLYDAIKKSSVKTKFEIILEEKYGRKGLACFGFIFLAIGVLIAIILFLM